MPRCRVHATSVPQVKPHSHWCIADGAAGAGGATAAGVEGTEGTEDAVGGFGVEAGSASSLVPSRGQRGWCRPKAARVAAR